MILYTSVEQQVEPQQEASLTSVSCKAILLYFSFTRSFNCSAFSIYEVLFYCNIAIDINKKINNNQSCWYTLQRTIQKPTCTGSKLYHRYNNKHWFLQSYL